jgi:hypothetical protein
MRSDSERHTNVSAQTATSIHGAEQQEEMRGRELTKLRPGERVRVRSAAVIAATLDQRGRLDGLPFMPEMLQFCGQELPVFRRADKVCDSINKTGNRRMRDTVHLQEARCDGAAHGGCQAACLLHWKEAWLERIDSVPEQPEAAAGRVTDTLQTQTIVGSSPDGEPIYSCQATHMLEASQPLGRWDLTQYARDVSSGNAGLRDMAGMLRRALANRYQTLSAHLLPGRLRIRDGRRFDDLRGDKTKTPRDTLGLRPGELVEVKPRDEIVATLDLQARNRGLEFEPGMLPYCGRRGRVLARVTQIIDEKTGRMRHLQNDCVLVEGMTCSFSYHGFCPRATYVYWREQWLRRVP